MLNNVESILIISEATKETHDLLSVRYFNVSQFEGCIKQLKLFYIFRETSSLNGVIKLQF
eukprot:1332636-Rhodomonas_salina.1